MKIGIRVFDKRTKTGIKYVWFISYNEMKKWVLKNSQKAFENKYYLFENGKLKSGKTIIK